MSKYSPELYTKNKVKTRKSSRNWYLKNREKIIEKTKKYYQSHKDAYKLWHSKNWRQSHPKTLHLNWAKLRLDILKRDNYICLNCGKLASEVHHKDGSGSNKLIREQNNNIDNLISVCHKCNILLDLEIWGGSFNRGKWKKDTKRNNYLKVLLKDFSQVEVSRKLGITRQRVNQLMKKI